MLSAEEKTRYKRQFLLSGWSEEQQEQIKQTRVFVAGAGGTGSPTITMLALLGVGSIKICDFDVFEETNKNRQFIHSVVQGREGLNKARSAAMTVASINPHVQVEYIEEKLDRDNAERLIGDCDMIFDCFDRFQYKFVLADYAARKGIPMFFYGIMDYGTFGYIFYPPKTACFHCLFEESKKKVMELVGAKKGEVAVMAPTLFTAAGLMVAEAVKFMTDYDEPAYNKFFMTFGNRHKISAEKGTRAFRFWNTRYFNKKSLQQGFDWKNADCVSLFEILDIERNPECSYCGGEDRSAE